MIVWQVRLCGHFKVTWFWFWLMTRDTSCLDSSDGSTWIDKIWEYALENILRTRSATDTVSFEIQKDETHKIEHERIHERLYKSKKVNSYATYSYRRDLLQIKDSLNMFYTWTFLIVFKQIDYKHYYNFVTQFFILLNRNCLNSPPIKKV